MEAFLSASLTGRTSMELLWVTTRAGKGCGVHGQAVEGLDASVSVELIQRKARPYLGNGKWKIPWDTFKALCGWVQRSMQRNGFPLLWATAVLQKRPAADFEGRQSSSDK